MLFSRRFVCVVLYCFVFFFLLSATANGQSSNKVRPLITQPVSEAQLTALRGNVHPMARAEFDQGAAPADLPMQRMLLVLRRSAEQERALAGLLDRQQDKASPSYHQWLAPEQFGTQFGPADSDIQAVTGWLQGRGFQVAQVSKGRTVIEFSGTAAQVQQAFHTSIHKYTVKGEAHWANASDPQIPAALAPVVAGVASLHNFFAQPLNHFAGTFSKSLITGKVTSSSPLFTFPEQYCSAVDDCFAIGPYDFATIYNLLPLWNAGTDGTGETIAIVGRTNINPQDAHNFRALFGLADNDPTIILNGPDPGINNDEGEANIDVQWSGAAAPGAKIDFVVSESTETTDGVDLSALYIVDNNLAGVMSESYGQCEYFLGAANNQFYAALWQQAAAQGITAFVSTGDNGSSGCDSSGAAQNGLQANGLASTPFNVAVGGTDFNDFNNPLTYWNTTNTSTTQASAKSYVPETTWNDSCTNSLFGQVGFSTNAETNCNNPQLINYVSVGGIASGGKSSCSNGSPTLAGCAGYSKPSWQTGASVPSDGRRDLPDVSLFASNGFLGSFYIVCQQGGGSCDLNSPYVDFSGYGGTSVASPALAGIMAMVDQKMGSRQGNANYVFYKLAAKSGASCASKASPAGTCTFYDTTVGTIAPPCLVNSPNCTVTNTNDFLGVLSGYSAAAGYDLATGLGSVNATNLVNNWNTVTFTPSTTTLSLNAGGAVNITHGTAVNVAINVKPQTGSAIASGPVALMTDGGQSIDGFVLDSSGAAAGTTKLLPGGAYKVTANYGGSATLGGSSSSPGVSVTVGKENSKPAITLAALNTSDDSISYTNTVPYGSIYLLRVDVENGAGIKCDPDPIGEAACPTGSVTLTDNGQPLDTGTYRLNNLGFLEDQTQALVTNLTGGAHTLQAQYGGDNSFNASVGSAAVTVSKAPTSIIFTISPGRAEIDGSYYLQAVMTTSSYGVAPTGSLQFLLDGLAISGTPITNTSLNPAALSGILDAGLDSSVAPGPHNLSVRYDGDTNYAVATTETTLDAILRTNTGLTADPASPASGMATTITAVVDSAGRGPALPSTIFFDAHPDAVTGTPTFTQTTDSQGNSALRVSISYTPQANNNSVAVRFTGDDYYESSISFPLAISVAGNDFKLGESTSLLENAQGFPSWMDFFVDGQASYAGPTTFSCSGLPAETTCGFSPASVTGSGSTQLGIATTGPHTIASARSANGGHYAWLVAGSTFTLAGMVFMGGARKRRGQLLVGLLSIVLLLPILSCGGGSSTGGGGGGGGGGGPHTDPGTPRGSYTVTVTATGGGFTHTVTFTLQVE